MEYGCRIGKVKMKGGGAPIFLISKETHNFRRIETGWGEIVVRCYDGEPITNETLVYALEAAKLSVIAGK